MSNVLFLPCNENRLFVPCSWRVWPGGQAYHPPESLSSLDLGLSGSVDWSVSNGAVILETGGTTAQNLEHITVRYDIRSPSASANDAVRIEATKDNQIRTTYRTIFEVSWILNFTNPLDMPDDKLRFANVTGTDTDHAGFNWIGDHGATWAAAKMEAVLHFQPTGIKWSERRVAFLYGGEAMSKFSLRLQRKAIRTLLLQAQSGAGSQKRHITINDQDWVYDGGPDRADAQYPKDAKPNKAFRIDYPFINPQQEQQAALRADFREVAEWYDGINWLRISPYGEWHANITSILPNNTKVAPNGHGPGTTAAVVLNHTPSAAAHVATQQPSPPGSFVVLDGSGSTDPDNDQLIYQWNQTGGTPVTLSDPTSSTPSFTAPNQPGTLTFELVVSDICKELHHHQPNNFQSAPMSVTVVVKNP